MNILMVSEMTEHVQRGSIIGFMDLDIFYILPMYIENLRADKQICLMTKRLNI